MIQQWASVSGALFVLVLNSCTLHSVALHTFSALNPHYIWSVVCLWQTRKVAEASGLASWIGRLVSALDRCSSKVWRSHRVCSTVCSQPTTLGLSARKLHHFACCDYASLCQVVEASGLAPVGEVLLVPDLSAAVAVPGSSLGDVMAPVDMMEKDLSE
jgi:hypothetical protein